MPGVSFQLPIEFDLAAVFLFALTGVWAATKRGYDIVGAFVLAFVTGVGGGLLRDGIFLQEVPVVIRDGRFIWAVLAALAVGGSRSASPIARLLAYVDAAAIGVYAVYGANKSLVAGAPEAAVLVGLCNAVGGGCCAMCWCRSRVAHRAASRRCGLLFCLPLRHESRGGLADRSPCCCACRHPLHWRTSLRWRR